MRIFCVSLVCYFRVLCISLCVFHVCLCVFYSSSTQLSISKKKWCDSLCERSEGWEKISLSHFPEKSTKSVSRQKIAQKDVKLQNKAHNIIILCSVTPYNWIFSHHYTPGEDSPTGSVTKIKLSLSDHRVPLPTFITPHLGRRFLEEDGDRKMYFRVKVSVEFV